LNNLSDFLAILSLLLIAQKPHLDYASKFFKDD
jgi:hypothetical protein